VELFQQVAGIRHGARVKTRIGTREKDKTAGGRRTGGCRVTSCSPRAARRESLFLVSGGATAGGARDRFAELRVRLLGEHVDGHLLKGDAAVRTDHEEIARVEFAARRAVELSNLLVRVAAEEDGEAGLPGPICEHRVWIDADAEQ